MTAVHAVLLAAMLCAAPAAQAVMYKWLDENGTVTYSNAPPADESRVRDVTRIDDISPDLGKREKEDTQTGRSAAGAAAPPPATNISDTPAASTPDAAPRTSARSLQTEAVRDPCLKSPDPQCHEKNRDKYHPYLGYAPSTVSPPPVGATSAAEAGGAVGGTIVRTEPRR